MSAMVTDDAALRRVVAEEMRRALEPVMNALASHGR